jgi:predicted phosphodiesterase
VTFTRVAALYDIHGNLPALEAVLREVDAEAPDAIVVGGDVLWGPFQAECVELLASRGALFLAGNCEREVLHGESDADTWCRAQLSSELLDQVERWPTTVRLDVPGLGRVLFCHATPRSDEEILTRLTPDEAVAAALAEAEADVVLCGHTHVQLDRLVSGAPRLVNAGSVGMPCEGQPGARWALLGSDIELRTTGYSVGPALLRLRTPGFPWFEDRFVAQVRGAVTAESASEYFESLRNPESLRDGA